MFTSAFLIIILLISVPASAEVVVWKPKGEITVTACMAESFQEKCVCEAIVKEFLRQSDGGRDSKIRTVITED